MFYILEAVVITFIYAVGWCCAYPALRETAEQEVAERHQAREKILLKEIKLLKERPIELEISVKGYGGDKND